MVQWSPSGCALVFCKDTMSAHWRKPSMEDVPYFINICATISSQVLNLHDFFVDFDGSIQIMQRTLMTIFFMWVLGSSLNDRKSSKDKSDIGNSKANIGWSQSIVNHTSAECVQISLGPSPRHIVIEHHLTGRVNVMMILYSRKRLLELTFTFISVLFWISLHAYCVK